MPKLYLAKVNLNSKIFSVYENNLSISEVLKCVYEKDVSVQILTK